MYPFEWRLGRRVTDMKPRDCTYFMYCLRKVCLRSICHNSSLCCFCWLTGESVGVRTGLFFSPSWLLVLIALRLVTDWPELCRERWRGRTKLRQAYTWVTIILIQNRPLNMCSCNLKKSSYHFFSWGWDQLSLSDFIFLHDLFSPYRVK